MRIAVIGTGYVGLVSGACFSEFGVDVACVDKDDGKIARLKTGEIPIYEPGLEQIVASNAARRAALASPPISPRRSSRRRRGVHRRRHAVAPRRRPCRSVLRLRRRRGDRRARSTGYTVVVTKSTVPVGTGRKVAEIIRKARARRASSTSSPIRNSCARARRSSDFMRPDRVVIGTESERAREVMRELYRPLYLIETPIALHRARDRRADQIRRQQLPRHQDHLHQRDRRSVRRGRRRRPGRRQGHRPRRPHRPQVPACRARLWRLVLPQGLPGAGAHRAGGRRAGHASSRPWSQVNDAPQARDGRRASSRACGGSVAGKTIGGARPHLQAQHRRHARQPEPRPSSRPCRRPAPPSAPSTPRAWTEARKLLPDVAFCARRL